jgi:hypothetical protein
LESSCKQTSKTVTEKLQPALLPEVSVAEQDTVVAPSGKALPEGGVQMTLWTAQLSAAVGAA